MVRAHTRFVQLMLARVRVPYVCRVQQSFYVLVINPVARLGARLCVCVCELMRATRSLYIYEPHQCSEVHMWLFHMRATDTHACAKHTQLSRVQYI